MSTTGHENEVVRVSGLKATMRKGGNLGIPNKAACSTAAATAAKTITLKEGFSLEDGAMVLVTFENAITVAAATLAVTYTDTTGTQQTTAAKPIYYRGSALAADLVPAGSELIMKYCTDGVNSANDHWEVVCSLDTTYKAGTAQLLTNGVNTEQRTWTAKILKDWFTDNYLIPVDMDSLSLSSTFIKGNVVAINGVMYRAKTNTSNFPITLMTQDGNFLYNEINGHRAYIVADYTLDTDWEVWTDAGIDYHIAMIEEMRPLAGSGAPSVTPTYIGQQYVDCTTPALYCAKAVTGSTADWFKV